MEKVKMSVFHAWLAVFLIAFVLVWGCLMLLLSFAQDASKLAPVYQSQRNAVFDGLAQCNVQLSELQVRIADLEKQLAEAKK